MVGENYELRLPPTKINDIQISQNHISYNSTASDISANVYPTTSKLNMVNDIWKYQTKRWCKN
jgi:hypothetical protein